MKTLLAVLGATLFFTSCVKIEGQLNITQDTKLKTTKGVVKTVAVGTYTADIKANTKKKITLRLNDNADEKFEFNVPDGSIPANGTFKVLSNVVGQPVDISGNVVTVVTNSERKQTTESCQYQEAVQVCYPNGNPGGGVTCSIQYQTRFGTKWVSYYDRRTDKDLTLSILKAGASEESGQFQGDVAWIDRIVLNETQCR
jgi:hypothetical protein